jgi:hypothetical protein
MAFLKHTEDFDKLNQLAVDIDTKKKSLGAHGLCHEEQVLDSIWTAVGVLENGSFQYFSECGLDAGGVAQAYEKIGMQEVAALFKHADHILRPVSNKPWNERLKFLVEHESELDKLAAEVLKHTLDGERKLLEYVHKHAQEFSCLL